MNPSKSRLDRVIVQQTVSFLPYKWWGMKQYNVKSTSSIGSNTLLLTLQPKNPKDILEFYPGQYAAIGFKRNSRPSPMRCFSVVSAPNSVGELQFALRVQGKFTRVLAELQPGSKVFVHGPFGNFVIDEQFDRNVVMMAGGIGVTPFVSMARHAAQAKLPIPITLLYSCQSQDDIPFYEELLWLEKQNPYFRVGFFVTNGDVNKLTGGRIYRGRIDEKRIRELTQGQYNRFTYFICGPKHFMKGMKHILTDNQTESHRIVTEEFTPASPLSQALAPKDSLSRWTYAFSGASLVFGVALIMILDLVRVIPRTVSAQASQQATTSQNSSSSSSTDLSPSTTSSSSSVTTPTTSTDTSTTNNSANTNSSTPTYYYQQPVSSVS